MEVVNIIWVCPSMIDEMLLPEDLLKAKYEILDAIYVSMYMCNCRLCSSKCLSMVDTLMP